MRMYVFDKETGDRKLPFMWAMLGVVTLWGLIGYVAYVCGQLLRTVLM